MDINKKVIRHYKEHFSMQDIPYKNFGKQDKVVIEWGKELAKEIQSESIDKYYDYFILTLDGVEPEDAAKQLGLF